MLYDTALLRTLVAICDCGSFTKAAGQVNLTQSAVSLHIKRLEDQVGAPLVVRNARSIRLTEQGEILQSYARRILALHLEAEQHLGRGSEGSVRVGAPEYFDLHTLSSLLRQFSSHYPSIGIQIELGVGPDISALVDSGELDLAIVSHEIGEGDGVALARERRVWAAGRSLELSPDQPAPLALYPPYCRWRQLTLEELDRAGRSWQLVIQSAGTAGILASLDAGLAITILPEFNLPPRLKTLGRVEALPPLPDFEFVLRRSRSHCPAADHLAEMIVNFFQLSSALMPGEALNYKQRASLLLQRRRKARGAGAVCPGDLVVTAGPVLVNRPGIFVVLARWARPLQSLARGRVYRRPSRFEADRMTGNRVDRGLAAGWRGRLLRRLGASVRGFALVVDGVRRHRQPECGPGRDQEQLRIVHALALSLVRLRP